MTLLAFIRLFNISWVHAEPVTAGRKHTWKTHKGTQMVRSGKHFILVFKLLHRTFMFSIKKGGVSDCKYRLLISEFNNNTNSWSTTLLPVAHFISDWSRTAASVSKLQSKMKVGGQIILRFLSWLCETHTPQIFTLWNNTSYTDTKHCTGRTDLCTAVLFL